MPLLSQQILIIPLHFLRGGWWRRQAPPPQLRAQKNACDIPTYFSHKRTMTIWQLACVHATGTTSRKPVQPPCWGAGTLIFLWCQDWILLERKAEVGLCPWKANRENPRKVALPQPLLAETNHAGHRADVSASLETLTLLQYVLYSVHILHPEAELDAYLNLLSNLQDDPCPVYHETLIMFTFNSYCSVIEINTLSSMPVS